MKKNNRIIDMLENIKRNNDDAVEQIADSWDWIGTEVED
jgi:hypothetical protein